MKNSMLKAVMIASLVMAVASPAVMPTMVLAQADIRQEDRRADRQQNWQRIARQTGSKTGKMIDRWTGSRIGTWIGKRTIAVITAGTSGNFTGLNKTRGSRSGS